MSFQPFDRLPMIEWAMWWNQTIERWLGEGLPAGMTDRYELYAYFGLDLYRQDWFRARGPAAPRPARHGTGIIRTESDY